jgi:hypothetical protein
MKVFFRILEPICSIFFLLNSFNSLLLSTDNLKVCHVIKSAEEFNKYNQILVWCKNSVLKIVIKIDSLKRKIVSFTSETNNIRVHLNYCVGDNLIVRIVYNILDS